MKSKRQFRNLFVTFALLIAFVVSFAPSSFAQSTTINYVSLGDSLAAGQTPFKKQDGMPNYDNGYTDYIKGYLQDQGYQVNLEEYGQSRYTTSNILEEVKTKQDQRESIKNADVITLNAGANDLLQGAFDPKTYIVDPAKAFAILETIRINYGGILKEIKTLNPDVDIYVMGYYDAYPYLGDLDKQKHQTILQAVDTLNTTIKAVTQFADATFVPTFEAMNPKVKEYLPNPNDIHPNLEGYKTLANALWSEIKFDAPFDWKQINKDKVELTQNVPLDKTWKIKFSTTIDENTITDKSIYILDSEFKPVPLSFKVKDGQTLEINPLANYASNKTYHLYITKAVKSVDGKPLIDPVSMKFSTINN